MGGIYSCSRGIPLVLFAASQIAAAVDSSSLSEPVDSSILSEPVGSSRLLGNVDLDSLEVLLAPFQFAASVVPGSLLETPRRPDRHDFLQAHDPQASVPK